MFKDTSRSRKIGEDGRIGFSVSCLSSFTKKPTFCRLNWGLFILNTAKQVFTLFFFDNLLTKLVLNAWYKAIINFRGKNLIRVLLIQSFHLHFVHRIIFDEARRFVSRLCFLLQARKVPTVVGSLPGYVCPATGHSFI